MNISNKIMIAGLIVIVTCGVYYQIGTHKFITYDDPTYVVENRHVRAGLEWKSVKWAFTAMHASNWHPLTWLSHMLDCELFEVNAGRHHLVNLFFHLANTVLLLLFLQQVTGSFGRSVFVAGLFALHPLHVESVAWIAERKDVLSTFFWLSTMLGYVHYAKHRTVMRYCMVMVLFVLGLMAKPMLVTLPFVLLLVDYWLLETHEGKGIDGYQVPTLRLVVEKAPLVVFSVLSSIITLIAQQQTVASLQNLGLYGRISNATVSYVIYLTKIVWPINLAVFYPYMGKVPIWKMLGAIMILVVVTTLVIFGRHRFRYAVVGWVWYIVTLVPVIGLVQVGLASYADRYTYVPSIGVFVIISWSMADLLKTRRCPKMVPIAGAGVVLVTLAVCTWMQLGHWQDSVTLYKHALAVTNRNPIMHNNLGVVLKEQGEVEAAVKHWEAALKIYPKCTDAIVNLGPELVGKGQIDKAIKYYEDFLSWNPGSYKLHNNLGVALQKKGRIEKAIKHYQKALDLKQDLWQVHFNLGLIFYKRSEFEKAAGHLRVAVRIHPRFSTGHAKLAYVLILQGKFDEAIRHGKEFVRLEPNNAAAKKWLSEVIATQQETRK